MKKLIIIVLMISNYVDSSSILKKSMDYTSPKDQRVSRKATDEIRNSNISKILHNYTNYLKTGEGENIDWENLKAKGFLQEDIDMMKRWIRNFYFDTPNILPIVHPQLPTWIDSEFDNLTDELALNLETQEVKVKNLETDEFEAKKIDASRLGPIDIRKGIINFIILKANKKYRYVKKEHRPYLSNDEKNYKQNFLRLVDRYVPKFEYIENIDTSKVTNVYDFEYLIVKAQDFTHQNILSKLNTILTNDPDITVIAAFDDNANTIHDSFRVPDNISNLVIIGLNITSIGSGFLYKCSGLTSLDLTPLKNITSINNSFLFGCSGLTSLDLTPLKNVTSIGDCFLLKCPKLKEVELSDEQLKIFSSKIPEGIKITIKN